MVTIGIDASRANAQRRTGVEWHAYHLIQALKRLEAPDIAWVLFTRAPLRDGLQQLPTGWTHRLVPWRGLPWWTVAGISWSLWRQPVDLWYSPTHNLPWHLPRRVVATIHDIGFERSPRWYGPTEGWLHRRKARRAVALADRILTVSDFSRREILDAYQVPADRVRLAPNAVDPAGFIGSALRPPADVLARHDISHPFLLYLGRLEAKKNVANLVRAFGRLHARPGIDPALTLVLAGAPGHGIGEIEEALSTLGPSAPVRRLGYIEEADLPSLLAGASALLLPSRYEGFGIPILQAHAAGTPVVGSDRGSIPEVAGDAALLVDPEDPDAIADAVQRLLDDPALGLRLREAGRLNLRRYRWDDSASSVVQNIREVLGLPLA